MRRSGLEGDPARFLKKGDNGRMRSLPHDLARAVLIDKWDFFDSFFSKMADKGESGCISVHN